MSRGLFYLLTLLSPLSSWPFQNFQAIDVLDWTVFATQRLGILNLRFFCLVLYLMHMNVCSIFFTYITGQM